MIQSYWQKYTDTDSQAVAVSVSEDLLIDVQIIWKFAGNLDMKPIFSTCLMTGNNKVSVQSVECC